MRISNIQTSKKTGFKQMHILPSSMISKIRLMQSTLGINQDDPNLVVFPGMFKVCLK